MSGGRHDPFQESDTLDNELASFTPKAPAKPKPVDLSAIEEAAKSQGHSQRIQPTNKETSPPESKRSLSFQLPESVCEEFGYLAAKEFGHVKRAKTKFFLKLLEGYQEAREAKSPTP